MGKSVKKFGRNSTVIAIGALAASAALAQGAVAEDTPAREPQERAVIHVADLGGIRNWRAEDDRTVLIEGRNRQWYRAELFGYCPGLRFAHAIGFVTDITGDLDKFSSIYVDGDRCWFKTFEKIDPPAND